MKKTEQNDKEIVATFIRDFWNRNDSEAGEQLLSEDYMDFSYKSKEGLKQFANAIFTAFPDCNHTIKECVSERDKVITRIEFTGTNTGNFQGNEPTGKSVRVTLFREFKIIDGKISSHLGIVDSASLKSQLEV